MADRSITARFRADISGYMAGVAQMSAATRRQANETLALAQQNRQAFSQLGTVAAGAGVAIGAGLLAAANTAAQFEQAMSKVGAVSNASAAEMTLLRDSAINAGKATVFSASEAATAQSELAKAGIATADVLGGALSGSLSLAAAGGLDLANAATISAQAMNIFKLEGSDVGHIADVLAAGANKSAADVGTLGDALRQGGLVAAQTGLSLEETVGALSAFADSALVGSDAGTSLKTMLQRLTPQSAEAQQLMDELGFSAYDAAGNFVGLEGLAGELQTSLAGMTVEQRNAAMATLFGSDAVRGANVLYEQGAEGIAGFVAAVDDVGAATRMAATLTDNWKGDLEALGGSWETLLIEFGEGAQGPLRSVTQELTGVVNAAAGMPEGLQQATLGLGGLASAAGVVGGGLLLVLPRVMETKQALDSITLGSRTASEALGSVGKGTLKFGAIAAGAFAVGQALDALGDRIDTLEYGAPADVDAMTTSLMELGLTGQVTGEALRLFQGDMGDFGGALDRILDPSLWQRSQAAIGEVGTLGGVLFEATPHLTRASEEIASVDQALAGMVSAGNATLAAESFDRLADLAAESGFTIEELREILPAYQGALDAVSVSARADADAMEGLAEATGATWRQTEDGTRAFGEHYAALDEMAQMSGVAERASLNAATGLGVFADTAERAAERAEWLAEAQQATESTLTGMVEPFGAYSTALDDAQEAAQVRSQATIDAYREAAEAGGEFTDAEREHLAGLEGAQDSLVANTKITVGDYLGELERQVEAQDQWQINMLTLSGRVSAGTLAELARMGPEGAALVAQLADATDPELARMETAFEERSAGSVRASREQLEQAGPVLSEVMRIAGRDTVNALAEQLEAGTITVAEIEAQFGIDLADALNPILAAVGQPQITLSMATQGGAYGPATGLAAGGPVPGFAPADSPPPWQSPDRQDHR